MRGWVWRLVIRWWIKQPISAPVPWTEEDSEQFRLFLGGGCGKRFLQKLRQAAAERCFRSVYGQASDAVSSAGYARGFCDCLGMVLRLSSSFPVLESEYGIALDQPPSGPSATEVEQSWRGVIGGGGLIAPQRE
jgi:hypothetical protein